jgi:hypothetical protein
VSVASCSCGPYVYVEFVHVIVHDSHAHGAITIHHSYLYVFVSAMFVPSFHSHHSHVSVFFAVSQAVCVSANATLSLPQNSFESPFNVLPQFSEASISTTFNCVFNIQTDSASFDTISVAATILFILSSFAITVHAYAFCRSCANCCLFVQSFHSSARSQLNSSKSATFTISNASCSHSCLKTVVHTYFDGRFLYPSYASSLFVISAVRFVHVHDATILGTANR